MCGRRKLRKNSNSFITAHFKELPLVVAEIVRGIKKSLYLFFVKTPILSFDPSRFNFVIGIPSFRLKQWPRLSPKNQRGKFCFHNKRRQKIQWKMDNFFWIFRRKSQRSLDLSGVTLHLRRNPMRFSLEFFSRHLSNPSPFSQSPLKTEYNQAF